MRSIDVASRNLFFKDVQPERNQPLATIMLLHGAGGSHLSWRRQIEGLGDRFRLIAVDLPGHGLSGGEGEATVKGHAGYVVGLMDALQLESVALGGHSMGGAIALDIALRNPKRIGSLLLVGTGARLKVLPAIFSMIRSDFELAKEGMANFVFGPEPPQGLVEEQKRLLGESSPNVLLQDFTACDLFDVINEIASITLPTLILCGEDDRLTPVRYSQFLHEKIRGSEIALFKKCGHMPMLERSEEFNRRVASFLSGLK